MASFLHGTPFTGAIGLDGTVTIQVRMEADIHGYGQVLFGTTPTDLNQRVSNELDLANQTMTLSGLTHYTRYYYQAAYLDPNTGETLLASPTLSFVAEYPGETYQYQAFANIP